MGRKYQPTDQPGVKSSCRAPAKTRPFHAAREIYMPMNTNDAIIVMNCRSVAAKKVRPDSA